MKNKVLISITSSALLNIMENTDVLYIGIGYNSFTITNSDITIKDTTTTEYYRYNSTLYVDESEDEEYAMMSNIGIILTNNSKINLSYSSNKQKDDSKEKTASVIGISYDYSFNNYGTRRGWYIGGGISIVTVEFNETSKPDVELNHEASSESSRGLLFKGGYEYKTDDHFLIDIGYTFNTAKQDHEFKGKNSDGTTNDAQTWNTTTYLKPIFNMSVSFSF
jgi:opacity protein-like surface antigen